MNTSSGKAPHPIQFSRRSTTTTRVIALIGCCLIISAVVVVSTRANSALRSGKRLHKRNKFFNPKAVAPGITVDQVVSLKEVPVPEPMAAIIVGPIPAPGTDLNFQPLTTDIVKSQPELLRLGKALFWDMQVGSDGVQSCATCHFNAGADIRTRNQISPNLGDTNFHNNIPPNWDGFGADNLWGDATVPYTANDPLTPNPPGPFHPPPAPFNVPGFPQVVPTYDLTSAHFPINDWFPPTELTPMGPGVTIFDEFANVSRDTNDITSSHGV